MTDIKFQFIALVSALAALPLSNGPITALLCGFAWVLSAGVLWHLNNQFFCICKYRKGDLPRFACFIIITYTAVTVLFLTVKASAYTGAQALFDGLIVGWILFTCLLVAGATQYLFKSILRIYSSKK